jgi:hypothetical protein
MLRIDMVEPRFKKSSTESDDPNVDRPYTDNEEPSRRKLLRDKAEPKLHLSTIEMLDPKRVTP